MHSVQDGALTVRRCRELGAKGLLHKGEDQDRLIEAVRKVHAGKELWSGSAPTTMSC
jgi:DNA-binding NarL/FixJ family response regulator